MSNTKEYIAIKTIINTILGNGDNITVNDGVDDTIQNATNLHDVVSNMAHTEFDILTIKNTNGDTLATMVFICDNNMHGMDVLSDYTYNEYTDNLLNAVYKTLDMSA